MNSSQMKKDIETLNDVRLLVDTFYDKIREDDLLKDIFQNVIKDNWDVHLEKMYRFWQTVLLDEHTYNGSPFLPHVKFPIHTAHFERWLTLFNEVINSFFEGKNATKAKLQGERMAAMFHSKINYYRENTSTPLI